MSQESSQSSEYIPSQSTPDSEVPILTASDVETMKMRVTILIHVTKP